MTENLKNKYNISPKRKTNNREYAKIWLRICVAEHFLFGNPFQLQQTLTSDLPLKGHDCQNFSTEIIIISFQQFCVSPPQ